MLYFLLGDSSSISSTLDEDNEEDIWETENVSLLVANVAVAVGTTTLMMYIQIAIVWFIICSWEINSSIHII